MTQIPPPPAAASTPLPPLEPQTAVAPLNTIAPEDIAAAAGEFDAWLREKTDGYLTLERLTMVAGSVPVIGNLMALLDAAMDVVNLVEKALKKQAAELMDWVNLGVNLIGVIPAPGMSAARMTLRPTLHLLRQELSRGGKQVGEALLMTLEAHLNDKLAGELDSFAQGALSRLDELLKEAAGVCDQIVDALVDVLHRVIGDKALFDLQRPVAVATRLHDSKAQSELASLLAAGVRLHMQTGNFVAARAAAALPDAAKLPVQALIASLTDFKGAFRASLSRLADEKTEQSLAWILRRLLQALAGRKKQRSVMVGADKGARVVQQRPGEGLGAIGRQAPARQDPSPCKLCPAPGATSRSISYATGSESFTHTDFVLAAPLPIEWRRSYRSHATAFDHGPQGARWLTPYSMRVDVQGQGKKRVLVYHGADGRSHRYPWLETGRAWHDKVEEVTVRRLGERMLALDFGKPVAADPNAEPDWREVYEWVDPPEQPLPPEQPVPAHFRLLSLHGRESASIGLRYDHQVAGRPVLSDILSKQGGQTLAHVGVQPDAQGRIAALFEMAQGQVLRQLGAYTYDAQGDLVQAQDENAAAWQYSYRNHLVTRYTDRTGRGTNLQYDHFGERPGERPDDHQSDSTKKQPLPKAIREWADDGSFDTRLAWDENIRLVRVTDALGGQTWVYFDIEGYTYRVVHADRRQEWFFRDEAKNLAYHIHPDGSTDHYSFDEAGQLLKHVRRDGSELHFEYDRAHRLSGILDPDGGVWRRSHDRHGRLVEETDPLGHTTTYAHDKAGRVVELTDAKGGQKKLAYTPSGQLARYTDCSGRSTAWEYDARGRIQRVTDAAGQVTRYRYTDVSALALEASRNESAPGNHPGHLEAVLLPDGSQEQLLHDAEGRLLAHTDALGRKTAYRYDEVGLIAQRTDAAGQRLDYRWDRLGRLTELRNENGQPYRFEHDPVGRLLAETGFDGRRTEYRYTEATGVLEEVVDGPVSTRLAFDGMGRLTRRQATAPGQNEQTETFSYHPGGQLGEARNEHSRLLYVFDAAGNLVREHHDHLASKQTAIWQHRYDALGQRSGTTRPDGHTLEWLGYGSGHVHGLLLDGQEVVGFERDALHREVQRLQANGLVQTQRYDAMGRLLEQEVMPQVMPQAHHRDPELWSFRQLARGVGSRLGEEAAQVRRYYYDVAGQLTQLDDSRRGALQYRYDPVGRLLRANGALGNEYFAFDPAGNIAPADPEADHRVRSRPVPPLLDNLLKDYAGTHYRHDERGNLVERVRNGVRSEFAWDAFNRMTWAVTPQGTTRYAYDPLGRRIGKVSERRVSPSLPSWSAGAGVEVAVDAGFVRTETLYGWDGDVLAYESRSDRAGGSLGGTGGGRGDGTASAHTIHYVHEAGSFVPLLQASRPGAIDLPPTTDVRALKAANFGDYDQRLDPLWNGDFDPKPTPFTKPEIAFYQCDHLGTPQELTDHEGKIAWEASYKAWGWAQEAISEAAKRAGFRNPIRFQGQYFDEETGLHYNRYRYYDPHSGRFTQSDPIGLAGGINTYSYVGGNPISYVDPMGLDRWGAEGGRGIVYTQMDLGRTVYYDAFSGDSFVFPSRNRVASSSKPGAADPYSGLVTYCERGRLARAYGTAKMRTTDSRSRWIHGGGSGLSDPWDPQQGWKPTEGCTRAQNEDVDNLCSEIDVFRSRHPNGVLLYRRD